MTHEDAGHYSAKHPPGSDYHPEIAAAIKEKADGDKISCAKAHQIAGDKGISPAEIGKTIDLLEYRLIKCQLGLFGYEPEKKIVAPMPPEELTATLKEALILATRDDKIACRDSWQIAARLSLPRMTVAAACETLGIKVSPCQLGAF
ncbi:MAG: hypothetical protein ACLFS7_02455 [Desulfosudaceae bacterium]